MKWHLEEVHPIEVRLGDIFFAGQTPGGLKKANRHLAEESPGTVIDLGAVQHTLGGSPPYFLGSDTMSYEERASLPKFTRWAVLRQGPEPTGDTPTWLPGNVL